MDNTIFRKKSVERVSSPEELDKYLKVTSLSVWMSLIAIIVILCGVIVWGVVGKIETSVPTGCQVSSGKVACYIDGSNVDKVIVGNDIVLDGVADRTKVTSINGVGYVKDSDDNDLMRLINANVGEYLYCIQASTTASDGLYSGKIIIESISPLKFIFN